MEPSGFQHGRRISPQLICALASWVPIEEREEFWFQPSANKFRFLIFMT